MEVADIIQLKERELSPYSFKNIHSIGYSHQNIENFTKIPSKINHRGCVNTVRWNSDGTKLISGSDDRTIKLWDTKNLSNITLIETLSKYSANPTLHIILITHTNTSYSTL